MQGYLDAFDPRSCRLQGWAWNPQTPTEYQTLAVLINGQKLAEAICDQYRGDLKASNIADGYAAFLCQLDPLSLAAHATLELRVVHEASGFELTGSPMLYDNPFKTAEAPAAGEPAAAAEAAPVQAELLPEEPTGPLEPIPNGSFIEWAGPLQKTIASGLNGIIPGVSAAVAKQDVNKVRVRPRNIESMYLATSDGSFVENCVEFSSPDPIQLTSLYIDTNLKAEHFGKGYALHFYLRSTAAECRLSAVEFGYLDPETQKFQSLAKLARDMKVNAKWYLYEFGLIPLAAELVAGQKLVLRINLTHYTGFEIAAISLVAPKGSNTAHLRYEDPVIERQKQFLESAEAAYQATEPAEPVPVEIIIPVYYATEYACNCLRAVLNRTPGKYRVSVIVDGGGQTVANDLAAIAAGAPNVSITRNAKNLGYTRAINLIARKSTAEVLVFLNSDTEVGSGWLDGILATFAANPSAGIVGPLTNAGSYQSVPEIKNGNDWAINPLPNGIGVEDMAQIVEAAPAVEGPVQLAFLNGFCFAVASGVFEKIGYFDEQNFPMGYGEENDFCVRAKEVGFTLSVAPKAYVHHFKSKSFGSARRSELTKRANDLLAKKHGPINYAGQVAQQAAFTGLDALRVSIQQAVAQLKTARG